MLNRADFFEQMERLQRNYNALSNDTLEDYYMKFKFFEIGIITQAIDYLLEYYQGNFTPKISEILGAINEIRRQAPYSYLDEETPIPVCKECEGTGFETWYGVDGRFKAKPCTHCEKGRKIAEGWRAHFKKVYKRELIKNKEPKESGGVPF